MITITTKIQETQQKPKIVPRSGGNNPLLGTTKRPKVAPGAVVLSPDQLKKRQAVWRRQFAARPQDNEKQLLRYAAVLHESRKFGEIEALIRGYMEARPKGIRPWMYQMVAIAIEATGGKQHLVEKNLTEAGRLAQEQDNDLSIFSVATMLFDRGMDKSLVPLLDRSLEAFPHRLDPHVMSLDLSERLEDPQRMRRGIEQILALGWPGRDKAVRNEVTRRTRRFAEILSQRGEDRDAELLRRTLKENLLRDLEITLSWDGTADLDLIVEESLGAIVRSEMPRSVFGGALLENEFAERNREVYVCPRAFPGDYSIRFAMIFEDPDDPVRQIELTVRSENPESPFSYTETIDRSEMDEERIVSLETGRRKKILPYTGPLIVTGSVFGDVLKDPQRIPSPDSVKDRR